MKESDQYAMFRDCCNNRGVVPGRYENAIASGIFDASVSHNNVTIWVEFKADHMKMLSANQMGWARRRFNAGCTLDMFVIFASPDGFLLEPVSYVLKKGGHLEVLHSVFFPSMGKLVDHLIGKGE